VESSREFGIEHSGSIKCWETIEWSEQLGISRVAPGSKELVIPITGREGL
jgi:hypothetical protein